MPRPRTIVPDLPRQNGGRGKFWVEKGLSALEERRLKGRGGASSLPEEESLVEGKQRSFGRGVCGGRLWQRIGLLYSRIYSLTANLTILYPSSPDPCPFGCLMVMGGSWHKRERFTRPSLCDRFN